MSHRLRETHEITFTREEETGEEDSLENPITEPTDYLTIRGRITDPGRSSAGGYGSDTVSETERDERMVETTAADAVEIEEGHTATVEPLAPAARDDGGTYVVTRVVADRGRTVSADQHRIFIDRSAGT